MLPKELSVELEELDEQQREIVLHRGSVVALAGPGAGKTRTLVARAAYILATELNARQGVAAITYTTKASEEVGLRLRRLGVRPGRRLVNRTLHSFCLREIIQPLAQLTDEPALGATRLIGRAQWLQLLEDCFVARNVQFGKIEYETTRVGRIRRLDAAGLDVDAFGDERMVQAVRDMEREMRVQGLVDFESMAGNALRILASSPALAELVATRLPHLIVDEYQDLGPVLHRIVLILRSHNVTVTAVGDPDQTMYAHDGADPRYLRDLASHKDFLTVPITTNYRSGPGIVSASQRILKESRGYQADPGNQHVGQVDCIAVGPSMAAHAKAAVRLVQAQIINGVPAEDIALLYPAKGPLLDALLEELVAQDLPVVLERARNLPSGPLADFIYSCAARRVAGPLRASSGLRQVAVPTILDLAAQLRAMRVAAGLRRTNDSTRDIGRSIVSLLEAHPSKRESMPAAAFVEELVEDAGLDALSNASPDERDRSALDQFREVTRADSAMTVGDIAGGRALGKVMLTTYHSAKGREFDTVILPGLCEGIVPRWTFDRSRKAWVPPSDEAVDEARRNFYVAVTRALRLVILIHGPGWELDGWNDRFHGPSRFVADVMKRSPLPP
jgi:DNA helicase-2/ATP-dependent DNA helicase PcrA